MKMKKYSIYGCALLVIALLLGACGDKEKVKSASTAEEKEKSEFGFRSFDLSVDTADHKDAIEASMETKGSTIEAEYVNRIEPKKLKGDKAYEEMKPMFKKIDLSKDMSKEDVLKKVSKAFDVEDYTKFDLEVEFSDGKHKVYKDKKKK
ncbi:YusW family protein [Psychrobacillus sp. NPDC058041]|uniref:YusW family protein n=1 Tax=Psychrobacillus sp. NPDC058041 TaxID=3346310 RepID=UPI0036DBAE69